MPDRAPCVHGPAAMAVSSPDAWRALRSWGRLCAGAHGWHCAGCLRGDRNRSSPCTPGACALGGGGVGGRPQSNNKTGRIPAPGLLRGRLCDRTAKDRMSRPLTWPSGGAGCKDGGQGFAWRQGGQGPWSPIRPECVKKRKRSVWPSGAGPGGNGKAWRQWAEADMASIAGAGDTSVRCKPRRSRRRRTGVVKSLLWELFFFLWRIGQ